MTYEPVTTCEAGEEGVLPDDEGDELGLVSESDSPAPRHFLVFTPHVRPVAQSAVNTNSQMQWHIARLHVWLLLSRAQQQVLGPCLSVQYKLHLV